MDACAGPPQCRPAHGIPAVACAVEQQALSQDGLWRTRQVAFHVKPDLSYTSPILTAPLNQLPPFWFLLHHTVFLVLSCHAAPSVESWGRRLFSGDFASDGEGCLIRMRTACGGLCEEKAITQAANFAFWASREGHSEEEELAIRVPLRRAVVKALTHKSATLSMQDADRTYGHPLVPDLPICTF